MSKLKQFFNKLGSAFKKAYLATKAYIVKKYYTALFNYYNGRLIRFYRQKKNNVLMKGYYAELIEAKNRRAKTYEQLSLKCDESNTRCDANIQKSIAHVMAIKEKLGYSTTQTMENDTVLQLNGLCMYFGGVKAVDDLSFELKKGEIFGLIGPNGAGKTTVFNCITQFYKPTRGSILFKSGEAVQSLNDLSVHNVIPFGISRTFQNVETIWELSVLENVMMGAHTNFMTGLFSHMLHLPKLKREEQAIKAKALKVLEYMGISAYAQFYAYGLPYGVLKKIEICRALMCDPEFIILDEPAAGMNEAETKELAQLIKKIRTDYNCTVFLVEHDMGLVMDICDRICAISFGKKLALGTPKEIQTNQQVIEAYLGSEE